MFNLIGVAWITSIFGYYMIAVLFWAENLMGIDTAVVVGKNVEHADYGAYVTALIASVHTGFNVVNVLIFLPFVSHMVRFLTRMVPDAQTKERPHLTYLDVRMLDTPSIGLEQSRKELSRMTELRALRFHP